MPDQPRKQQRLPVSLEVLWEAASTKLDARMTDISTGGCFIDSILHADVGEVIAFKVHLPTGHWVQLRGEVIHFWPNIGVGMRFVDLSEEETTLIEQVVLAYGGDVPPRPGPVPAQSNEVGTKLQQRILIADDDPTIRHLISVIAQREGFLVVAARDGREALNAMKGDSGFTAVIFDMMMPYVNGLDLVRFMRADEKLAKIPAGIITAEHDPKLWEDSIAAGAGIFLPKPFTTDQMRYMLRVLTLQGGAGEA